MPGAVDVSSLACLAWTWKERTLFGNLVERLQERKSESLHSAALPLLASEDTLNQEQPASEKEKAGPWSLAFSLDLDLLYLYRRKYLHLPHLVKRNGFNINVTYVELNHSNYGRHIM